MIHVCDETRDLEKTFICNRNALIQQMKYFQKYLNVNDKNTDIDISVHCDLHVFEWLMDYINNKNSKNHALDIHNVVSILISSHFLGMDELINDCISYMCRHMNAIIELPLDLQCLDEDIIDIINEQMSIATIDAIIDPSLKIKPRLFKKRLTKYLARKCNRLYRCAFCHQMFTREQRKLCICFQAPIYINFNGECVRRHSAAEWDISKYLLGLRLQSYSWQAIYWNIWGLTQLPLYCHRCKQYCILPHMHNCAFHDQQPCKSEKYGLNVNYYDCCQFQEKNFQCVSQMVIGCNHQTHDFSHIAHVDKNQIQNAKKQSEILDIVGKHAEYIIIPFKFSLSCALKNSYNNKNQCGIKKHPQSATSVNQQSLKILTHDLSNVNHRELKLTNFGVWNPEFYIFGCSLAENSCCAQTHYSSNMDEYACPPKFWFSDSILSRAINDGNKDNQRNRKYNENMESFEYLSYLLSYDSIDLYGEGEDEQCNEEIVDDNESVQKSMVNTNNDLGSDSHSISDSDSDDKRSLNEDDIHDVLVHVTKNQNVIHHNIPQNYHLNENVSKKNKTVSASSAMIARKNIIRGRRLNAKNDTSANDKFVYHKKKSNPNSLFGIQQNDMFSDYLLYLYSTFI